MLKDIVKVYKRSIICDPRGWFLKVITGTESGISNNPVGEVYITCGFPNQSKGGHYHKIAGEWFTCIKGKACLQLEDIDSREKEVIDMDSANPITVFIPQKVAHSLSCIGQESFVVIAYTDRQYDKADTIPYALSIK